MAQTQYRNIGKGCEGILPQGKGPRSSRKLGKVVVIYKTDKFILSKKSLKSTRKRIEARKKYLNQKVAALNLFSSTNQVHILCFWYHFEH